MVGATSKAHRLSAQFLIYIAITVLSRHLVTDGQKVADSFRLYRLLTIACAILLPSLPVLVSACTGRRFGNPEGDSAGRLTV